MQDAGNQVGGTTPFNNITVSSNSSWLKLDGEAYTRAPGKLGQAWQLAKEILPNNL